MRRREKFVIGSVLLSLLLLAVQYVPLEWRYLAVGILAVLSYAVSAWVLIDDMQRHEWVTIVPFPSLYAAAVAFFYFLLPTHFLTRIGILGVFGIGMYALYLVSNIFSVAKGRTIQLLHAAHAISTLFTLITSLLFLNTIFSLKLVAPLNGLLVALTHWPLALMSLWSINLEPRLTKPVWQLSVVITVLLVELTLMFSFLPLTVWHSSLFLMSFLYISLGMAQSYLRERLFNNTLTEFSLVAFFVGLVFFLLFPGK